MICDPLGILRCARCGIISHALSGSLEAAEADNDCMEAVSSASDLLPSSFGGYTAQVVLQRGRGCDGEGGKPRQASFKTRLLAVFLASLLSRRKVRVNSAVEVCVTIRLVD